MLDGENGPSSRAARFIAANLRLVSLPMLPEIRVYVAHPASGLRRLIGAGARGADPPPPYWAYHWAGGAALARFILDRPEWIAGRRVLDLGSGSGVVAIAAATCGAASVVANDVDAHAIAAIGLNAAANNVRIATILGDMTTGEPPHADAILVGDLFYDSALAQRVAAFLEKCAAAGATVLVGDPGRAHLPRERLRLLAEIPTPDFGEVSGAAPRLSGVYAFDPLR